MNSLTSCKERKKKELSDLETKCFLHSYSHGHQENRNATYIANDKLIAFVQHDFDLGCVWPLF